MQASAPARSMHHCAGSALSPVCAEAVHVAVEPEVLTAAAADAVFTVPERTSVSSALDCLLSVSSSWPSQMGSVSTDLVCSVKIPFSNSAVHVVFPALLQEALDAQTKNSNFIKLAIRFRGLDFATKVIKKLENCRAQIFLDSHLAGLRRKGLIALDDYSLAIL